MSENTETTQTEASAPAAATVVRTPGMPERDGTVLHTIKAPGSQPYGLAFDGQYLWTSDRKDRKIYKLEAATGHVVFTIAFDGDLTGTAWDGQYVWQADQQSRTISRIDPENGQIDRAIKVDVTNGDVAGICYDLGPDGNEPGLWYALSRLGQARKVKPDDGAFMRGYPTHSDVCGIVPNGKHLFYSEPGAGLVHKVHALAGSLVISYRVGGRPTGLALAPGAFWIADQDAAEIRKVQF